MAKQAETGEDRQTKQTWVCNLRQLFRTQSLLFWELLQGTGEHYGRSSLFKCFGLQLPGKLAQAPLILSPKSVKVRIPEQSSVKGWPIQKGMPGRSLTTAQGFGCVNGFNFSSGEKTSGEEKEASRHNWKHYEDVRRVLPVWWGWAKWSAWWGQEESVDLRRTGQGGHRPRPRHRPVGGLPGGVNITPQEDVLHGRNDVHMKTNHSKSILMTCFMPSVFALAIDSSMDDKQNVQATSP